MPDEYLPMRHVECGRVAFELRTASIAPGGVIKASDGRYPSGRQPAAGDRMVCDACGVAVSKPRTPPNVVLSQGEGWVMTGVDARPV